MKAITRQRHLSVRAKVSGLAAAIVTCVMILCGVVFYFGIERVLIDNTAQNLRVSAAGAIVGLLNGPGPHRDSAGPLPLPSTGFPQPGPPPIEGLPLDETRPLTGLARFLTTRDTAALTTDTYGASVADGPTLAGVTTVAAPLLDASVYRVVAATNQERHLVVQAETGPVLIELVPLVRDTVNPPQTVGVLELSTSLRGVESFLRLLRVLLAIGTFVAVLTIAVLLFLIVAGLLRPLRRMEVTSLAIAAGDLSLRVPVPAGDDELTHLARAFNEMVSRLETAFATQRRFVADASHELRSPIAALGNGIEMLMFGADEANPAARTRLLQLLGSEVNRMSRLVDDLLTLTRFDANPLDAMQHAPLDLNGLMHDVADVTRLLAPDRTIRLDAPADEPVMIDGDADRLRQALLNLCANARAYTPPGGTITLGLKQEGHAAVVTVADTGSGIAAEHLPHVWERFYRADPARARQSGQGGQGLGLAIVRAVIAAHGGTASIASAPGAGTTVSLTLPALPASEGRPRPLVAASGSSAI